MKSTPYVVTNNKEEAHSRFRTSKVSGINSVFLFDPFVKIVFVNLPYSNWIFGQKLD
jgi:hypothetical protein